MISSWQKDSSRAAALRLEHIAVPLEALKSRASTVNRQRIFDFVLPPVSSISGTVLLVTFSHLKLRQGCSLRQSGCRSCTFSHFVQQVVLGPSQKTVDCKTCNFQRVVWRFLPRLVPQRMTKTVLAKAPCGHFSGPSHYCNNGTVPNVFWYSSALCAPEPKRTSLLSSHEVLVWYGLMLILSVIAATRNAGMTQF